MQAGPGYLAAFDLHRLKNSHRGDFTGAAGVPLDGPQFGFVPLVFELIRQAVLIMVACPSAGFGIRTC